MEQGLSVEVLKGKILLEANAANYQKLLQGIEDISFDKNDLKADQPDLVLLSGVEKRLKAMKNPYTEDWKKWNECYGSIFKPISEGLERKRGEFGKLANEIKADAAKVENENKRINDIKAAIQNKSIEFSQSIASATTNEELIRIEKLIGSEKARKNVYAEFLPQLIVELDKLTPLIKIQKDILKKLIDVNDAKIEAGQFENDERFLELTEIEEKLIEKIEQNKTEVQTTALNSAINKSSISVESESTTVLPKPKRRNWTWEVTDINILQKRYPHLVKVIPNEEAIKELMKSEIERLKEHGSGELEERIFPGLRIYQKSTY